MVIGENSLLIFLLEYLAWAGFFKKIPQRKLRDLLDLTYTKDTPGSGILEIGRQKNKPPFVGNSQLA
tara:strand:+ start:108 stop:308 length:201 start_codon:yes stop_codon:yes gene_type:complete